MSKFLLFFFSVYTFMHGIIYVRFRGGFPVSGRFHLGLILFFLLMIIGPVMCRILERSGHDTWAQMIGHVAFNWMGWVFLLFCGAMVLMGWDGIWWIVKRISGWQWQVATGRIPSWIVLGLVLILGLYGMLTAWDIQVRRIRIQTSKLPPRVQSIRIVQISDVHLGILVREKKLRTIIDLIKSENPDILVSTGDLVDGSFDHISPMAKLFLELNPPYGKFAVTGNHEFYAGIDRSVDFTRQAGFQVLRQQVRSIEGLINIVGVDDYRFSPKQLPEADLFASIDNGLFTLFLKHRPVVHPDVLGLFDLQLSGHTHGGQIFPFHYIVSIPFPYLAGYYQLPGHSAIYTSRGTGTWGPQMRLFSPSEITVIELVHPGK